VYEGEIGIEWELAKMVLNPFCGINGLGSEWCYPILHGTKNLK